MFRELRRVQKALEFAHAFGGRAFVDVPCGYFTRRQVMADVLVVISKVKARVKAAYELRVSEEAVEVLSGLIEVLLSDAADAAKKDKRKTIQARDFQA